MSAALETVVVGAGRLARVLVPVLHRNGWPLRAIVVRSTTAARRMRALAPGVRCTKRPTIDGAGLVLLAVPDGRIRSVAESLAAEAPGFDGVALHFSGVIGPEAVEPLGGRSGSGVLHPLQSFGPAGPDVLEGSRARVEGGARASRIARRLARAVGLRPMRTRGPFDASGRAVYHAAASLAANDVVALLAIALDRLEQAGVDRADALDGLLALVRGVTANVTAGGLADGLTGPVTRADADTLRRHLEVLAREDPEAAQVHRLLSRRLVELLADRLDPGERRRLLRVLGAGPGSSADV